MLMDMSQDSRNNYSFVQNYLMVSSVNNKRYRLVQEQYEYIKINLCLYLEFVSERRSFSPFSFLENIVFKLILLLLVNTVSAVCS